MKITRRFALTTLLVLAVAVVLGAPAPASAGPKMSVTCKLYPTADSPNRNATGTVTLLPASTPPEYVAVAVSVSKLVPNASYYMPVTVLDPWRGTTGVWNVPIQTDAHGKGEGAWSGHNRGYYNDRYNSYFYDLFITSFPFQVYDSSGTLVLTSNP